jgi:hypothetical protein
MPTMTAPRRQRRFVQFAAPSLFVFLLGLASGLCAAQATPAAAAASAAASAPAKKAKALPVHVRVIEDDNVRIEESHVRGRMQRITVQNKIGPVQGYEIIVPPGGKDSSQDRGASGQRAWSLFAF